MTLHFALILDTIGCRCVKRVAMFIIYCKNDLNYFNRQYVRISCHNILIFIIFFYFVYVFVPCKYSISNYNSLNVFAFLSNAKRKLILTLFCRHCLKGNKELIITHIKIDFKI
ncbi:hypothetical protein KUTeg_020874 [Tegillarca granosa]|uniref:Uncharacterized protein n=1 Tax=Tegillarca granosa TaxID=220873 RepID=A0ABQ9EEB9_TEGGR|nr:hypothetical protein KUTeg_020874 [Tegillarca granosa]